VLCSGVGVSRWLGPEGRRGEEIKVRLTLAERAEWVERSRRLGVSVGEMVRRAVGAAIVGDAVVEAMKEDEDG